MKIGVKDKLLLIYPFDEKDPLITLRYCKYILRRQGYSFKIVEPAKDWRFFYLNFQSMRIEWGNVDIKLISTLMSIDYLILKTAEFESDLTLVISGSPVAKRALKFFNEHNIFTILWFIGGPEEFEQIKPVIPLYSMLFTGENWVIEKYRNLEVKRLIWLKEDSHEDQFKEMVSYLAEDG